MIPQEVPPIYQASCLRWLMLLAYGLATIANAVLWITFAPIASHTASYYHVSTNSVNLLSSVFMMAYLPGSLMAGYCFNRFGLRTGLWVGVILNAASAGLRYVSAGNDQQVSFYSQCGQETFSYPIFI